jgi:hypothetical protein
MWYIYQSALEDEETQKKGFVALAYNVGIKTQPDRVSLWKQCKLLAALPVRYVSSSSWAYVLVVVRLV